VDCYQKAARLLADRPHFRAELARKLVQRGFPEDEIAAALDRLRAEGWLDDQRTAADFVAHRRQRGGEGRLRLRAELVRHGAPAAAIDAALAGMDEEDDLAAVRTAAERWTRAARRPDDRAALARNLARKGFSRRAIVAALNQQAGGSEGVEDDLETAFQDFEPE